MRRVVALMAALILLATVVPPVAAGGANWWHRVNPAEPSEHERFHCVVTGDSWSCRYDKLPENSLGFGWDRTRGQFHGDVVAVSDPDGCPVGMYDFFTGANLCADGGVTQVVTGTISYTPPDGSVLTMDMRLVFTEGMNGWAPMYQYFLAQFGPDIFVPIACPWHNTFGQALDANPAGEFDCLGPME